MPEIKVQCPQCQVTVRLASLPAGRSAITCPKCRGRVPLADEQPAPPRPKRRNGDWSELAPDDRGGPLFGGELWGGLGMLGTCIPLAIICFFGVAAGWIGLIGMWIILISLSLWGGIWLLVVAFSEDAVQGILCLFVPFYSLYYIITRFGECYRPLTVQLSSLLVIPFMIVGGVGLATSKVRSGGDAGDEVARAPENWPAGFAENRRPNFPAPPMNLPKASGKDRNDPNYLDYVLEDLHSTTAGHREDAARNLSEMRPGARKAEVVTALEAACSDPNGGVRAAAVRALIVWNGRDSVTIYYKALRDKDRSVAQAALEFVARQKDERAIEPLIESLPVLHGDAARALREFGPAGEKALIAAASKGTIEVRRAAMDLLKDLGTSEASAAALECLRDSDHDLQRRAIEFFKRIKDERAAEPLAEALANHRREAAEALRLLGPASEKALLAVALREDFHARREAIQLLQDIGTKESVPGLRGLLLKRGRENDAAKEALRSIAARYPKDFPPDKPPIWEVDRVTQALSDLQSSDIFKRGDALEQLLRLEPTERKDDVVKAIEPLTNDRDNNVRTKAIQIYGAWAGKDAVIKLIGFLSDQDLATREAAIKALGKTKDERAIAPLAARLPDFFDRRHVVTVLKDFGVKAQVEVSKYCTHNDGGVRQEATKLLGAIGDKEAIPALQKLINQRQDRALSTVATQAMAELKARLAAEDKSKDNEKK
jgi:HEAT repeat protein